VLGPVTLRDMQHRSLEMEDEPPVVFLVKELQRNDQDFAKASRGVQRLIAAALLPEFHAIADARIARQESMQSDPHYAEKNIEEKRWAWLAFDAFTSDVDTCLNALARFPAPSVEQSLFRYALPMLWHGGVALGNTPPYWVASLPVAVGLLLSATCVTLLWGV